MPAALVWDSAQRDIGRAVRLILITEGGGPGDTDHWTFGWPGKYTLLWRERGEKSGSPSWSAAIAEEYRNRSAASMVSSHDAGNGGRRSPAEVIAMHRGGSHRTGSFGGGTPLVALGIEDAEIMARDKAEVNAISGSMPHLSTIPDRR
jgi:hypothetical protein